ncbi:MAG TPA: hypothetical protein VFF65_04545 [Phycisphaerales bacterium]|nr:hypothetical protein [Phycisphaerales bacterium]
MNRYESILQRVKSDPRYFGNLRHGEPRPGHPEGTIGAHISELEANLELLRPKLSSDQAHQLLLLIHVHDTFKPQAAAGVAIDDPRSHASMAAAFLTEFCDEADLLAMVRLHDEPFALWRQAQQHGACNPERLCRLVDAIRDWDTFLAFQLIDNLTAGESGEPLRWFQRETKDRLPHRLTVEDLRPG